MDYLTDCSAPRVFFDSKNMVCDIFQLESEAIALRPTERDHRL